MNFSSVTRSSFYFTEFKAFYLKIFESQPTLAEQLLIDQELEEKAQLEQAQEELERSEYPSNEKPSMTDYK